MQMLNLVPVLKNNFKESTFEVKTLIESIDVSDNKVTDFKVLFNLCLPNGEIFCTLTFSGEDSQSIIVYSRFNFPQSTFENTEKTPVNYQVNISESINKRTRLCDLNNGINEEWVNSLLLAANVVRNRELTERLEVLAHFSCITMHNIFGSEPFIAGTNKEQIKIDFVKFIESCIEPWID